MTIKGAEKYRDDFESKPIETDDKDYAIKLVFKWVNKNGSYDNPIESEL